VDYIHTVADRVAAEVVKPDATDVVHHFARYTVHHYDTHTEALTYTRQTLAFSMPVLPGLTNAGRPGETHDGNATGDTKIDGGRFLLGGLRADPFVYDNEKWAHPVDVAPFTMARTAVTQADYAAFVDAGGYRDTRLWPDGGAWLAASRATHPLYW